MWAYMRVGVCMWYVHSAQPLFHHPFLSLSLTIPFFHSFIDSWDKPAAFLYSFSSLCPAFVYKIPLPSHYFFPLLTRQLYLFFLPLIHSSTSHSTLFHSFPSSWVLISIVHICLPLREQSRYLHFKWEKKSTSLTCKLTHVNYAFIAEC